MQKNLEIGLIEWADWFESIKPINPDWLLTSLVRSRRDENETATGSASTTEWWKDWTVSQQSKWSWNHDICLLVCHDYWARVSRDAAVANMSCDGDGSCWRSIGTVSADRLRLSASAKQTTEIISLLALLWSLSCLCRLTHTLLIFLVSSLCPLRVLF